MDAAASTRIKIANVVVSSSSSRRKMVVNAVNSTKPNWPYSTRKLENAYTRLSSSASSFSTAIFSHHKGPCLNPRTSAFNLVICSMKPRIDKNNNTTNKNPATSELGSKSTTEHISTSPPNSAPSSTYSRGLMLDLGPRDSWDGIEIGSPVVKRFIGDNEERWFLWYHGRGSDEEGSGGGDSIGLAVSSNGIHWARGTDCVRSCSDAGMVMNCRTNWWAFDTSSVRPSEMVIMSSPMYSAVYWLYYTGYTSEEVELSGVTTNIAQRSNPERFPDGRPNGNTRSTVTIKKSLPGLACSQDGRHWARIEGDLHSGAVLDVGSEKEWDSLFIAAPHVVVHGNDDLRMYYYSLDKATGHFAIGLARSRDGIRWVKYGKILESGSFLGSFDVLGVKNPCVVRNKKEGNYLMAYEAVAADGKRSIGMAVSRDGLKNWERIQTSAVLEPSEEDGWDDEGVGSPSLVPMEGSASEWRLYYEGFGKGGRTGIGMAVSDGSNVRTFGRWSGLCL